jgi:transposase
LIHGLLLTRLMWFNLDGHLAKRKIKKASCNMTEKINRQNNSTKFKEDAIKLVLEQGYSCLEVGRRLGVYSTNVSHWIREHRQDEEDIAEGGFNRGNLEEENRRLGKENK